MAAKNKKGRCGRFELRRSKQMIISELMMSRKSVDINDEYLKVFRTKSYVAFFNEQKLQNHVEPDRETVLSGLVSTAFLETPEVIRDMMLEFLNLSFEASGICNNLLNSVCRIRSGYHFIQRLVDDEVELDCSSNTETVTREFGSLVGGFSNSFSDPNYTNQFKSIREKYSTILNHLKAKRRKVARKKKMIQIIQKASGIICIRATELLERYRDQLDIAVKGTYILSQDFDTISRLVARLHDEVEHWGSMIRFIAEERFCTQVFKEIKKGDNGFNKQLVDDLEEHLFLCLATIYRTRGLVINEITK